MQWNIRWVALILLVALWGCKKDEKPIVYTGQLLLSHKFPVVLASKKIGLYQPGSPSAIIFPGVSSSSSNTTTDARGNFRLVSTPSKASLLFFSGTNANPLFLSDAPGDTTFPSFTQNNFPRSGWTGKPVFIGKTIDTAIIKVSLLTNLTATDTLAIQALTITRRISKEYTGRSAPAGSVITIDTISNLLFTDYDFITNRFRNNLYAGRKWITAGGYPTIITAGVVSPAQLSAGDEPRLELMFYFQK